MFLKLYLIGYYILILKIILKFVYYLYLYPLYYVENIRNTISIIITNYYCHFNYCPIITNYYLSNRLIIIYNFPL